MWTYTIKQWTYTNRRTEVVHWFLWYWASGDRCTMWRVIRINVEITSVSPKNTLIIMIWWLWTELGVNYCISVSRCSFSSWPVDLCQPQLIKSDTSSKTASVCHVSQDCAGFTKSTIWSCSATCFRYFPTHMALSVKSCPQHWIAQSTLPLCCRNPPPWQQISFTEWHRLTHTHVQLPFGTVRDERSKHLPWQYPRNSSVIIPVLIELPVLPST